MPLYECVVLGRQELSSTQVEALDVAIVDCLTTENGQVLKKESWGNRQLAYKINKNITVYSEWLNLLNAPLRIYRGRIERPMETEFYSIRGIGGIRFNL
jgi:ribosomal protein S6